LLTTLYASFIPNFAFRLHVLMQKFVSNCSRCMNLYFVSFHKNYFYLEVTSGAEYA